MHFFLSSACWPTCFTTTRPGRSTAQGTTPPKPTFRGAPRATNSSLPPNTQVHFTDDKYLLMRTLNVTSVQRFPDIISNLVLWSQMPVNMWTYRGGLKSALQVPWMWGKKLRSSACSRQENAIFLLIFTEPGAPTLAPLCRLWYLGTYFLLSTTVCKW